MKQYEYIPWIKIAKHNTSRIKTTAKLLVHIGEYLEGLSNDRIEVSLDIAFAVEKKEADE